MSWKTICAARFCETARAFPNRSMSFAADRSTFSPSEIVFYYGINRPDAVLPIDLLALRISPSAVRDPDLVNSTACAGKLGSYLGLNAESVLLDLNCFDKRSFESLVAGLHVGQIKISKDVRKQGQKPVASHMPEKKDTMRPPAHEPGAENCVCFA